MRDVIDAFGGLLIVAGSLAVGWVLALTVVNPGAPDDGDGAA